MRFVQTALLAGVSFAVALPALAGGWEAAEPCDWFQNAVIGTRCAQSFALTTGLGYAEYSYSRTNQNGTNDSYNPSGAISITPNKWLTLSYTSQFTSEDQNWTYKGHSYSSSTSYTNHQTFAANANLIDTGPGAQRFVINAYAGGWIMPSHDQYDEDNGVYGGFTINGQWRLNSAYSIVAQGQLELNRHEQNDNLYLYPHLRLLLSNDAAGIAVGPVFNSGQWLSSNKTINEFSYWTAGGTIIAQPFRGSQNPLLSGMTFQFTGQEYLDHSGFTSPSVEKTSQYDLSGTIGFHFRY